MSTNQVTLLGYYGSDERIALSAWQSTTLELEITMPEELKERIHALFVATQKTKKKDYRELLHMLAKHGHHTPFEKSLFDFQVTSDIASHIQFIKHRIAVSINTESARYKELQDKWYLPEDWKGKDIRQNSLTGLGSDFVKQNIDQIDDWYDALNVYAETGHDLYHAAVAQLTPELGRKRAKESGRYFFPYAKQLNHDVTFNLRSFAHFCHLRAKGDAQLEIQGFAKTMIQLIHELGVFDISLEALGLLELL